MAYLIDEVSLAYSTKLEEYTSVENDLISDDLDISIVSVSLLLYCLLYHYFLISVSEFRQPLPHRRIKITTRFL